jgi:phosphocarrier protein HPr
MTGEKLRQTVTITNAHGFHMRPMAAFAEAANSFPGTVTVIRPGMEPINGKSMLALMGLVAETGTELIIDVAGPGAAEAMQALLAVFQRNFDDEQESAR